MNVLASMVVCSEGLIWEVAKGQMCRTSERALLCSPQLPPSSAFYASLTSMIAGRLRTVATQAPTSGVQQHPPGPRVFAQRCSRRGRRAAQATMGGVREERS